MRGTKSSHNPVVEGVNQRISLRKSESSRLPVQEIDNIRGREAPQLYVPSDHKIDDGAIPCPDCPPSLCLVDSTRPFPGRKVNNTTSSYRGSELPIMFAKPEQFLIMGDGVGCEI